MLDLDFIQKYFAYSEEHKGLLWKINKVPRAKAGARAGSVHQATGYRYISIKGTPTLEQRLVWALVFNEEPPTQVGRWNEDKLDNSPENLFAKEKTEARVVTHEELLNLIDYDPITGHLKWLISTSNHVKVGDSITCNSKGYFVVRIHKILYNTQRIIWFYMTGEWPDKKIDHKDRVRNNNIWTNFRLANDSENAGNQSDKDCGNSTGFRGVEVTTQGRYHARVMCGRKRFSAGLYDTAEEAHEAYKKKHLELHEKFSVYYKEKA